MNQTAHPGRASRHRAVVVAALVAVAAIAAACTEKLDGGAACPSLCAQADVQVRDTEIDPFVSPDPASTDSALRNSAGLDTTISGFITSASASFLLASSRGNVTDAVPVFRFDTLQSRYNASATDTGKAITTIDSAYLRFRAGDTSNVRGPLPITFEVYDVDGAEDEPTDAQIFSRLTPGNLLGKRSYATRDTVRDSVRVPLDNTRILAKITGGQRLRVAVRAVNGGRAVVRLVSSDAGSGALLTYRPSPDTAVRTDTVTLLSRTPRTDSSQQILRHDYTAFANGTSGPVPANQIAVGGIDDRRAVLRFQIPQRLIDSTSVVQARLILVQAPNRALPSDTFSLRPLLSSAGPSLTDVGRLGSSVFPFLAINSITGYSSQAVGLDSLALVTTDSGQRVINLAGTLAYWRAVGSTAPRVIVLTGAFEGSDPAELRFYSHEAWPALRPRLRISYVLRSELTAP